jgi:hypothetical protein
VLSAPQTITLRESGVEERLAHVHSMLEWEHWTHVVRVDGAWVLRSASGYTIIPSRAPPLLVKGKPALGKGINASLVHTTTRPEGATQLTYNGHPLYLFAQDQKAGETNGQGVSAFGAAWFALSSGGNQVSAKPSSSNTGCGGGLGY